MKTIDLFMTKNERVVTNISQKYQTATVKSLKTRYMTLSSYDENNEYTGFDIDLRCIDCKDGVAYFEICKEGHKPTDFTINAADDPIIVFDKDESGVEHHVFEKISDYEINQEIKQGCLYKFQKAFTNEWFLAVVQSVGSSLITLNKLDISRDKRYNPTLYSLCQNKDIFGICVSDMVCIEKFKNYVVTKLLDLTTAFDDNDEDDIEEEK
jgi:hypothetical protein